MQLKHVASASALAASALWAALSPTPASAQQPSFTVFASHLNAPRGIQFGPDGSLYVAEAGLGGTTSTAKDKSCQQVIPPIGPYTGGHTSTISKITSDGTRTTFVHGLPSATAATGDIAGTSALAFLNGELYALFSGGGCSHGNPTSPNGVAHINLATGQWKLIADLSSYERAHPSQFPSPDDFEPDGSLNGMIAKNGNLWVVESNHGQIFSVSPQGAVHQVIDVSSSQGHIVPTSLVERHGLVFMGNLNLFPIDPQWARVSTLAPHGFEQDAIPGLDNGPGYQIVSSKAGFTTVLGMTIGPDDLLYVVELSDAPGFPTPGAGKVVRVKHSGEIEEVVTGLTGPTGLAFGPDGALYVSNFGAAAPGLGQILRFVIAPGY